MKRLTIKEVAKKLGVGYDAFWLALKNGKIPDRLVQKKFDELGHYEKRTFYASDFEDIRAAFEATRPSRVRHLNPKVENDKVVKTKRLTPRKRHLIAKKAAAVRWGKPVSPPMASEAEAIAIWLIQGGHKDAGIALLTEYKP